VCVCVCGVCVCGVCVCVWCVCEYVFVQTSGVHEYNPLTPYLVSIHDSLNVIIISPEAKNENLHTTAKWLLSLSFIFYSERGGMLGASYFYIKAVKTEAKTELVKAMRSVIIVLLIVNVTLLFP